MLVDKIGKNDGKGLLTREVSRPDGSVIVRTYCAFWQKRKSGYYIEKSGYYIEEFAERLRKYFS